MCNITVSAAEGLKNALKTAYGWTDAQAYSHMGISGMNGLSDQRRADQPGDLVPDHQLGQVQGPHPPGLLVGQP